MTCMHEPTRRHALMLHAGVDVIALAVLVEAAESAVCLSHGLRLRVCQL